MGSMGVVVKEAAKTIKNIGKGFIWIARTRVYVGIPDSDGRNANLLYLHTNGVPSRNIPPRPVVEPALKKPDVKKQMQAQLRAGMRKALLGRLGDAEDAYNKAGMIGAAAVQAMFGSDELAPNAPSTIARKGSNAPLIDTGAMRASVTYELRKG